MRNEYCRMKNSRYIGLKTGVTAVQYTDPFLPATDRPADILPLIRRNG
jgi:hypothetical protein